MLHVLLLAVLATVQANYNDPHCRPGRSAITHLFEWRWDDIAQECEKFLGPYGYCGVQISPPSENIVLTDRPWYERYQPISYKLVTRSGDEAAFRNMVERCNNANVRIYADAVINHMAAGMSGHGTGGSYFNADTLHFPAVPYGPNDFNGEHNCPTDNGGIHDYNDPVQVRNCRLVGLADLALGNDYVRGKVADFMNHLIDLGVAGFRVDAVKHMWPGDVHHVFRRLKNLREDMFGSNKRPFMVQEVIDKGGEAIKGDEYLATGRITNFKFGAELIGVFRGHNAMKWLKNFGEGWDMWHGNNVMNFIDNHDTQRSHGSPITYKEPRLYKVANAFMLAHPYGFPRVMSSFAFNSFEQGPPRQGEDIAHVPVNPDLTCGGGWICEHRWRQIYNMVAFRNVAGFEPLSNWWSGADYQIAFSRGNKAFIAINLEDDDLDAHLKTGLPQGEYCDVISGNLDNGRCTGTVVHVGSDGKAEINISARSEDPVVAIHVGAKLGSSLRRIGEV